MFHKSDYYRALLEDGDNTNDHKNVQTPKEYIVVMGAQLGDEGKGRIVDNILNELGDRVDEYYVVRSQGGSNAGHSVQLGRVKIGLHQIPSAVFHQKAKMILDFGMIIHPDDLLEEIKLVEKLATSLKGRLFLSSEAMMCTDLERAKEVLNRVINGKAKGGTGRGISPTTSGRLEKLGLEISDLMHESWKKKLGDHYDHFTKIFEAFGEELATYDVPDFKATKETKSAQTRVVGSREIFLKRLEAVREEFIKRDMVIDTFRLNQELFLNDSPIIFEMSQAIGLSPSFGTRPDVTTTETSSMGVTFGTRVFRVKDIERRIGVMKATYMSSVGARKMPTLIDDENAKWIRDFANEYGTTTGRPRDICNIDLPFLQYNIAIGEINEIAITHLDVARSDHKIDVCIGYLLDGKEVFYKPDMYLFEKLEPIYVQLDGWDNLECSKARSFDELPQNAQQYVKFIERAVGVPVTFITNGPDRDAIIDR